ncbi:MAG: hypothetical protein AAFO98_06100 [Pseudomonadota bacterium]
MKILATAAITLALAATAFTAETATNTAPAQAADSCGFFAFAGAYQSRNRARRQANRVGGTVWSVDFSNSPNAGQGWWAVGRGPGSRSQANRWKRQYQNRGTSSYVANRCFYGE